MARAMASETPVAVEVEALLEQGETKAALTLLERTRKEALSGEDLASLDQVLAGTRVVYAQADRKYRNEAGRIAHAAQQNIRFLTRKQALAAGEEWVDRSVGVTPVDPRDSGQRPAGASSRDVQGGPERDASIALVVLSSAAAVALLGYGVALELSVSAYYTGLAVLVFVVPPIAAVAAASFLWRSGCRKVGEFVGLTLGAIFTTFIAGAIVSMVIYSHS
jgi:hypothetical protein